jgi:hypothetical protein
MLGETQLAGVVPIFEIKNREGSRKAAGRFANTCLEQSAEHPLDGQ